MASVVFEITYARLWLQNFNNIIDAVYENEKHCDV